MSNRKQQFNHLRICLSYAWVSRASTVISSKKISFYCSSLPSSAYCPIYPVLVTPWSHVVWLVLLQHRVLIPSRAFRKEGEGKQNVGRHIQQRIQHFLGTLLEKNSITSLPLAPREAGKLVFLTGHILGVNSLELVQTRMEKRMDIGYAISTTCHS